jgi:hypothetical protein
MGRCNPNAPLQFTPRFNPSGATPFEQHTAHGFDEFIRQANRVIFYIMGHAFRLHPYAVRKLRAPHFLIGDATGEATKGVTHDN